MKAVEEIKREHALVRKLLRCLGALTLEARVAGAVDERAARPLLQLFERFVDWTHQDKEELHLFPHMLARATSQEAEHLERVVCEHAEERRRLVGMYLHLNGASRGRSVSVDRFLANSILYQRLQSKHVAAEEEFVLPLAEAILTEEDDRRIRHGFRQVDARLGTLAGLERQVAAVCRRFGVQPPPRSERLPALIGV